MSWFKEDGLRYDEKGRILRLDQRVAPKLTPGDRFYDVVAERWATLVRVRPPEEAMGAPFEALYDGCDRRGPFIAFAMHADIGEVMSASR